MFMTIPYMVSTKIPQLLQEKSVASTSNSLLQHNRVMGAVNNAYDQMTNEGNMYERSELLSYINMTVQDVQSGLLSKAFPLWAGQFICITFPGQGNQPNPDVPTYAERNIARTVRKLGMGQASRMGYRGYGYERRGAYFYLLNGGNVSTPNRVRVWFIRNVPSLHYGSPSAESTDGTDFFLTSTPDVGFFDDTPGIYTEQIIHIYQGTGVNSFARITTMESMLECNVVSADTPGSDAWQNPPNTSSKYEILPWFSTQHMTCLAYMAAAQLRNLDGASKLREELERHRESWLGWLKIEDPSGSMPIVDAMDIDAMGISGTSYGASGYSNRLI